MNDEKMMVAWSHNPIAGSIIGLLTTEPSQMDFMMELRNEFIVSAFIVDSNKRKWRVRANADVAGQLLQCCIGQKLKLTGIKGNLCNGAWDDAKRQIVPLQFEVK